MTAAIFKDTPDFKAKVPMIHKQFSFENDLKEMTIQAADTYVIPYIGQGLYDELQAAYIGNSMNAEQTEAVNLLQRSVGYYCYMVMHDTHSVHLSESGLQESFSDDGSSRPASAWGKLDSKMRAADTADAYLDKLLVYLEDEAVSNNHFPTWQASQAYADLFSCFIWNSSQLSSYTGKKRSLKLLMQILPSLKEVQERDICGILGQTLYDQLLVRICKRPITGALPDAEATLLKKIQAYMAKQGLLESIPMNRVVIAANGLFFQTYDGPKTRKLETAADNAVNAMARQLERQADGAKTSLIRYLEDNTESFPDYSARSYELPDGEAGYHQHTFYKGKGSAAL